MKHSICVAGIVVSAGLWAAPADAGCRINLAIQNSGTVRAFVSSYQSKVKSKGGTWRKLNSGGWKIDPVQPGEMNSDVYRASFGCGAKRRYRLQYVCYDRKGTKVDYYPSASGWTTDINPTISLNRCN